MSSWPRSPEQEDHRRSRGRAARSSRGGRQRGRPRPAVWFSRARPLANLPVLEAACQRSREVGESRRHWGSRLRNPGRAHLPASFGKDFGDAQDLSNTIERVHSLNGPRGVEPGDSARWSRGFLAAAAARRRSDEFAHSGSNCASELSALQRALGALPRTPCAPAGKLSRAGR